MAQPSIARRVVAGSGAIAVGTLLGRLASIPASPYLTDRVGPAGYGILALVTSVATLVAAAGSLGLEVGYARFGIDPSPERVAAVERLCWRLAISGTLAAGIVGATLFALLGSAPAAPGERALLAPVVAVWALLMTTNALASVRRRTQGRYARLAVGIFAMGVLGVGGNVVLAWLWPASAWALLGGATLGLVAGAAITGVPLPALAARSGLDAAERRAILVVGLSAALTQPAYWVVTSADRWFLAASFREEVVGAYSFSAQIAGLAALGPAALGATWLPEVNRCALEEPEAAPEKIGRLWERVAGFYLITWVAVSLAGGPFVRILAAPAFHHAAVVVPWLAGAAVLNGFVQLGITGYVMAKRLEETILPVLAAAGLALALDALLIGRFGVLGAAAAQAAVFLGLATLLVAGAQRVFFLRIRWGRVAAAGALGASVVALGARPWDDRPVADLLLKFPVGLACAAVTLAAVAPDWLRRAVARPA